MKNELNERHQYNQNSIFDQGKRYAQDKELDQSNEPTPHMNLVQDKELDQSNEPTPHMNLNQITSVDPCNEPALCKASNRNDGLGQSMKLDRNRNLHQIKILDHIKKHNLRSKSDLDLHHNLKSLVSQEREIVTEVIHHLAEVQRRHLYSDFKCTSLWDYATTQLGYSAGEAHVRISAMRLIQEVPEIEASLESGELSLTSIAQAQTFIRKEQKSNNIKLPKLEKKKLINSLKGRSTREVKKILIGKSKSPHIHRETQKQIEDDRLELKFSISAGVQKKLSRIKGRLAHKNLPTQEALFEALLDLALAHTEPKPVSKKALVKSIAKVLANQVGAKENAHVSEVAKVLANQVDSKENVHVDINVEAEVKVLGENLDVKVEANVANSNHHTPLAKIPVEANRGVSRHIPTPIRNYVLIRGGQKCVNCGSEHALQIDHKMPFRLKGSHSPDNLQVLCRNCNLRKEKVPLNRR